MKSLKAKLRRLFFLSNVLVLGVVFVFIELFILSKSPREEVFGINSESNPIRVLIGQARNRDEMTISSEVTSSGDARVEIIKRYLKRYKSPLVPYSELIFEVSQDYGFEYYWIVAIAQQESNLCKKAPEGTHNCWGYGIHKRGTLGFESYELSIRSYAEYLKREYFDKGLDTPELIMKKYCPSSDGSWARGVWQFINELESGDF
jgi:hypothetical protein